MSINEGARQCDSCGRHYLVRLGHSASECAAARFDRGAAREGKRCLARSYGGLERGKQCELLLGHVALHSVDKGLTTWTDRFGTCTVTSTDGVGCELPFDHFDSHSAYDGALTWERAGTGSIPEATAEPEAEVRAPAPAPSDIRTRYELELDKLRSPDRETLAEFSERARRPSFKEQLADAVVARLRAEHDYVATLEAELMLAKRSLALAESVRDEARAQSNRAVEARREWQQKYETLVVDRDRVHERFVEAARQRDEFVPAHDNLEIDLRQARTRIKHLLAGGLGEADQIVDGLRAWADRPTTDVTERQVAMFLRTVIAWIDGGSWRKP